MVRVEDRWHQSRRVLRPERPPIQCRLGTQPRARHRWLHPDHVLLRLSDPDLLPGPTWPPQNHDVGLRWPGHLDDVDRGSLGPILSPGLLAGTDQGHVLRQCCLLLHVHVHLWSVCKLHPLGLRPGDLAIACPCEGHCSWHLFQLDLGMIFLQPEAMYSPTDKGLELRYCYDNAHDH